MSMFTVLLASFPIRNKTLRFVSHNAAVNLYMFVITYFFEPYSADDFSYAEKENELDVKFTTNSSGDISRFSDGISGSP